MKLASIAWLLAPPIRFPPLIEKPEKVFEPSTQPPCEVSVATVTNELRQTGMAKLIEESAITPTANIRDFFKKLMYMTGNASDDFSLRGTTLFSATLVQ